MATLDFKGFDEYMQACARLGNAFPGTAAHMCNAGSKIVREALARSAPQFAAYIKGRKAKHNIYGWFAQVVFTGRTRHGTPANIAATAYEYGRAPGEYTDMYGTKRKVYKQEPRPFIRETVARSEKDVVDRMMEIYDEDLQRYFGV